MKIKKKYEAGAATNYITRTKAMRKLQLSLRDFRRLCILKGIYPREPTHKKTVNKGSTENRVWYYVKDIQFLTQEPIINKFREYKVFLKKVSHAKAKKDPERVKRLFETKPAVTLDRIVKERYPTFGTALRDLDDALCLCFAMATLPHTKVLPSALLNDCRRLTAEFAHYVIESHSLTKSFISIKGIYFQAEIQGERITWVVPHDRGVGHVSEVDFTLLSTFAEFYVAFLGFVNYRLYTQLGLFYPPKIETGRVTKENVGEEDEVVYSLARPLARRPDAAERDEESDLLSVDDVDGEFAQRIKNAKALANLFKNCIFWLNREVPKESLTLLIRGAGGTVTWEGAPPDAQGKTIAEDDPRITYQVVDRPVTKFVLSRTYVQPQWIWDCFNARRHMPTAPYAPGAALPPHFSPFVDERAGDYVPIERLDELRSQGKDVTALVSAVTAGDEPPKKRKKSEKVDKKKEETEANKKAMAVKLGYAVKKNPQKVINEKDGELKLRELMIAKKHRRVYDKIKHGKRRQKTEAGRLVEKRKKIEAQKTARASS